MVILKAGEHAKLEPKGFQENQNASTSNFVLLLAFPTIKFMILVTYQYITFLKVSFYYNFHT